MKKIAVVLMSVAMLLSFASCGGSEEAASSEAASSNAPSNPASNIVISMPSLPEIPSEAPTIESENLAIADGTTWIDMNTGKEAGDEGYMKYYGEDDGTPYNLANAFDGNTGSGWQTVDKPDANGAVWLGVEFEEATAVDMIVIYFESGSVPAAYESGSYRVEYSVDGAEWTVIEGAEATRTTDSSVVDAVSFETVEAKAFRVVLLSASEVDDGKWSPKIWELEVYAPIVEETHEETESVEDTTAE